MTLNLKKIVEGMFTEMVGWAVDEGSRHVDW